MLQPILNFDLVLQKWTSVASKEKQTTTVMKVSFVYFKIKININACKNLWENKHCSCLNVEYYSLL